MTNPWAMILAGGDGRRLRDLTREITGRPIPKQYCRIQGTRTLLETTLERAARFAPPSRTMVGLSRSHLEFGATQASKLPRENLIVQPCNRDTGPSIAFDLLHLSRRDPEATVMLLPSDQFVGDDDAFMAHAARARDIVEKTPSKIAVLGIHPDRADPELGYIVGGADATSSSAPCRPVSAFVEKPAAAHAASLVRQGALWNTFVLVFQLQRMLQLLERALPVEFERMRQLVADPGDLESAYAGLAPWDFSTRFLARIPSQLVAVRVDGVDWSDWGTRAAVERTLLKLNLFAPWLHRPEPEADALTEE